MDPATLLREIGGGLAGVVMVIEFLVIVRLNLRNEKLTDKLVELANLNASETRQMHSKTLEGMASLTTATQGATTVSQASLAALERRG